MSDTFFLLSFVLIIALASVLGGIIALLKQQVIVDKDGNPSEIELPWFGKIRTNYPSLFALALGIVLAGFVSVRLDPDDKKIRNMPLIATLESDDLPSGSYVMVAAFPQRYALASSELLKDGSGNIELSVDEPGPYTVVALAPTNFEEGRLIYSVTQGPAELDAEGDRLVFYGRLSKSGGAGGGGLK
ncbi:MAG: hypothetical protein Q4615_03385 [Paracoccus aminovorans]|nr:hypothetical protein [Paracoccus aminovorans]